MSDTDKLREAVLWARQQAACDSFIDSPADARLRADMLRLIASAAESTLPKTEMIEVWHVEYAVWACGDRWQPRIEICGDKVIAESRAIAKRALNGMSVVKITGPHMQEIPT